MDKKKNMLHLWHLLGWVNPEPERPHQLHVQAVGNRMFQKWFFDNAINNIGKKSPTVCSWYEKI